MTSSLASVIAPTVQQSRLTERFKALKTQQKRGLIAYITAGDPDLKTSADLLAGLPKAGADIIELAMPFSDPMADGPTIQAANIRAFKAGITLSKVLDMVRSFRQQDLSTPIILMGYYNPIYVFGVERFLLAAKAAGVDGLIVVDLPPEEDSELCIPATQHGLHFIRLITPTTDAKRLPAVLAHTSGFLYYVSVMGITGSKAIDAVPVRKALAELRSHTSLPIAVGFGISTPDEARAVAQTSDAVIVGSAIVRRVVANLTNEGHAKDGLVNDVLGFVRELAQAVHSC